MALFNSKMLNQGSTPSTQQLALRKSRMCIRSTACFFFPFSLSPRLILSLDYRYRVSPPFCRVREVWSVGPGHKVRWKLSNYPSCAVVDGFALSLYLIWQSFVETPCAWRVGRYKILQNAQGSDISSLCRCPGSRGAPSFDPKSRTSLAVLRSLTVVNLSVSAEIPL